MPRSQILSLPPLAGFTVGVSQKFGQFGLVANCD
jgi:hypothetical protein